MGFQCKQFYLKDDQCAMKVGTDSLLLGAWVSADLLQQAQRVLDIGTGCGVLALMLAQRTAANKEPVQIDAVELDAAAAGQALANVQAAPWPERMRVIHDNLLNWAQWAPAQGYDVLISNPPYFADALPSASSQRTLARHQSGLALADLVATAAALAAPAALFALVLPVNQQAQLLELAQTNGFALQRLCVVKPQPAAATKLILCELRYTNQPLPTRYEELTIALTSAGAADTKKSAAVQYTSAFKQLTQDFYLGRNW